ncbi:MAG TPA: hypothetical protein VJV75_05315, partial [Candidatus Polarisedimenticolia bacterium]|nr:hypothetical protein [Candidatus Polarisedimenticolia bacterium]
MSENPKPRCVEVEEQLALYYYERPDTGQDDPVGEHLAGCVACATRFRELGSILDAVVPDDAFPREREVDWDSLVRTTVMRARAAGRHEGRTGVRRDTARLPRPWLWP